MLNLIPIIFRSVPKCLMLWSISIYLGVQTKTGSEDEQVDLMDRFWQVFSGIKCRVASTHFKNQSWSSLPCSQYTHTPEYMLRYWGSASRTGSYLSSFCQQEILHFNLKGLGVQLLLFTCSLSKSYTKQTVNEELLLSVIIMGQHLLNHAASFQGATWEWDYS